ncbi:MAG: hypothetical protein PHU23_13950 [Dehalococcoidales bacterium]|nr:hypothetical protein [Dehalococcoidales bacterium]
MSWLKVLMGALIILFCIAIMNLLCPQQLITFFNNLGLYAVAGFVSGPWWRSVPVWVVPLGALLGVLITIGQSTKIRRAEINLKLLHKIMDSDFRKTLELIYSIDRDHLQWMTTKEKRAAESIISWFNLYGSLIRKQAIENDSAIFETAARFALITWYQLGEYVRELQKDCFQYGEYFEDFVHYCCINYHRKSCRVKFSKSDGTIIVEDVVQRIIADNYPLHPRNLRQIRKNNKPLPVSIHKFDIVSYGILYLSFSLIIFTLKDEPTSTITSQQIYIAYAYLVLSALFALWAICTTKIENILMRLKCLRKITDYLNRHKIVVYFAFSALALLAWSVIFAFDWVKGITGSGGLTQTIIAMVGGIWMLCLLIVVTWSFVKLVNNLGFPRWLPFLIPILVFLSWISRSGFPKDWVTWLELIVFVAFPVLVASGRWPPYGEMPFLEN